MLKIKSSIPQPQPPLAQPLHACRAAAAGDALRNGVMTRSPAGAQQQLRQGRGAGAGESLQRKKAWCLPHVVLQFDKQDVMVDALGGEIGAPVWMSKAHLFHVAVSRRYIDVSRVSDISISTYLRTQPPAAGEDQNKMGIDPLCRWDYTPVLEGHGKQFESLKVIGEGSFGKVMLLKKKDTQRIYALKTIRKAHIASRLGEDHAHLGGADGLGARGQPTMNTTLLVNGVELFYHLQREGKFDQYRSRFCAAELLCALEQLHSFNVISRDLKPENILLGYTGHIALCDFGLCKLNTSESDKTNTFCGTAEYIDLELSENRGYTKTVDWWTLGVLLYEMMTGLPPFYDENANMLYQRILHDPLQFPEDISSEARSIMTSLLLRDPSRRSGNRGAEEIKAHPFFARHIDWERLIQKKITPPFKPALLGFARPVLSLETQTSQIDVSNFDSEFTSEAPMYSVVTDSAPSETVHD
ncbi:hypothetical protein FRC00_002597 [Tulasnella sp. 408]|nr:hypothetical protein FRC00_002597 [Tulasnella sp. 408]